MEGIEQHSQFTSVPSTIDSSQIVYRQHVIRKLFTTDVNNKNKRFPSSRLSDQIHFFLLETYYDIN